MEYNKFREKPVKAESAYNIVPQDLYLDPDYSLRIESMSAVTLTGLLVVLRLQPTVPGLPSFVVRWDDKQNTIDVDLEGNVTDREAFKLERNGYKGHHPATVSVEPRIFKIDIQLPQRKVYEALLTCNVGRSVTIAETLQFKVEFSVEVLPSERKLND